MCEQISEEELENIRIKKELRKKRIFRMLLAIGIGTIGILFIYYSNVPIYVNPFNP